MTIAEVFGAAGLVPQGPVPWGATVPERQRGVYVVALVGDAHQPAPAISTSALVHAERERWIEGEPVIYIGRSRRPLARRIAEFCRHKYGKKAPHRGGQAVKLLNCDLWVYWAATGDPTGAEAAMIKAFRECVGKLPYANRRH